MTIPSFSYITAKLGNVASSTRARAQEIYDYAAAEGLDLWYMWGMGTSEEHATGRALDLMVKNKKSGDAIRDYLWKHRDRLGVVHVIWYQMITSTVVAPGVTRKMEDRGNSTENHKDHIHVLFGTKRYEPLVDDPQPSQRLLYVTDRGELLEGKDIKNLQQGLIRVFPSYAGHLKDDGVYGPKTANVVKQFQTRSGLADDGIVGPKTRTQLARYGISL